MSYEYIIHLLKMQYKTPFLMYLLMLFTYYDVLDTIRFTYLVFNCVINMILLLGDYIKIIIFFFLAIDIDKVFVCFIHHITVQMFHWYD